MLNRAQLNACQRELVNRKKELENHLQDHFGLGQELLKESVSELSNYDNHPGDHGTELFEREKDIALNDHLEKEYKDIKDALDSIDAGTYGICIECGEEIAADRLLAMPTTQKCSKHAEKYIDKNRPIEEEVLQPNFQNFNNEIANEDTTFFDAEDSWQRVEQYGSSDGPSDFYGMEAKTYDDMFFHSDELVGSVEELEGFLLADMEGKYIGVNEKHEKYEDYLDEQDIESILSTEK
ncbi:TraR/DksA C4-type zinc finger protein [Gracilibacillus dipsosauri]|uniref:TraR/DksA C4-type zinc finger protein n=1 Tax=Gracilibacillus dipsosauri TaxID=178340 RepID=UPI00240942DA